MASNVRSDLTDQDLIAAREKDSDEQYERQLLQSGTSAAFWEALTNTGVVSFKDKGLLLEWITMYSEKHDPSDFYVETGARFASLVVKLLAVPSETDATPNAHVDFALALIDLIARNEPARLSLFRDIAIKAYSDALVLPEVKREHAKLQAEIDQAQARASAAVAERVISGHKHDSLVGEATEPTRKELTDLNRLGSLYDNGVFQNLLNILNTKVVSGFQQRKALRVVSMLASVDITAAHPVHKHIFRYITKHLPTAGGYTLVCFLNALKTMLKNKSLHFAFDAENGLHPLATLLNKDSKNMQPIYIAGFCVWLLSFNPDMDKLIHSHSLVAKLAGLAKTVVREKVVRICLSVFVNLLNRSTFNEEMIGVDLHRLLPTLGSRKWKDNDINNDIITIQSVLNKRINELSSFEMYSAELLAGSLRKSPVHNEKFWRENCIKFEDNSYVLIKTLVAQLTSEKVESLEVACYDLGEFARFHPDGKKVLAKLDAKNKLMVLMSHSDVNVSKAALLAVQKILIHKWDQMISSVKSTSSTKSA